MKIILEQSIKDFNAWSGAIETQESIINENKCSDFDMLIDELYPDGLTETELNDLLRFDQDWVFESLGIDKEEE